MRHPLRLLPLPKVAARFTYPEEIMRWSAEIYRDVIPQFHLRENDYVLGNLKFGGNAQYICKESWIHHTTLLWDYDPALYEPPSAA